MSAGAGRTLPDLIAAHDRPARRRWIVSALATVLTALWAAALMVGYAATHEEYFWHQRNVSVLHRTAWYEASWPERAGMLARRGGEWAQGLVLGSRPDAGDGLGASGHPLLDPLTSVAALVGLGIAARGWRRPACGVLLAAVLVLPFGALLTVDDGLYRRTFGLAPFLAILAALPIAALWEHARRRTVLTGAIVLAIGAAAARNTYAYFGPLQQTPELSSVFPYQIDAAARFMARLPRDTVVYLYSDRWPAHFETITWYAPGMQVVDRSREFRTDSASNAPLDLGADPARPTAFVLLGPYLDLVDDLRARYPAATIDEVTRDGAVLYRAVRLSTQ